MKIVLLDSEVQNAGDLDFSALNSLGDVVIHKFVSYVESDLIAQTIGDSTIAITCKTPITKETIDKCENLKFIAILSTGYNVVDYEYARQKGILVANVPSYGTNIVAQHAVSLLLEICSHVGEHSNSVKNGKWLKVDKWCYWDYPIIELDGLNAGIIGLGKIGMATAKILNAMGMNVLADKSRKKDNNDIINYVEYNELIEKSDVLFISCPLFPETEGMINKETISKMKDGIIIINTSRGQLIVEQDLADALNCGKVYAAGLDVLSKEPIAEDNPLLNAKNCIITPHIAWASKAARQRIVDTTVSNIEAYLNGESINIVN